MNKLIIFMPSIEDGGVEKNLFLIANFLARKISKISLITVSKRKKNKFNRKIRFISTKINFFDNIPRRGKYIVCLFFLFFELLKNKDSTVLCFQANVYCTLICRLFNVKIITRSNSAPSGWSNNIFKKFIISKALSLTNKIIVNSFDFKKELKNKLNLNSYVIYNPLNKKEIIKKSLNKNTYKFFKKKHLNIINIGRLVDQKDQICLLKAINLIKNKINLRVLIIGNGIYRNSLLDFIKINNLEKIVKLKNFTNNPFPLIKSSDLFVLTSKYEGLPNVLLEAIALKKMIISSNCPTGPNEILDSGKGGMLFKVGNYRQLAKQILEYYKNPKSFNKKIKYSFKRLDRFDFRNNLENYYQLIKQINQ